jgi:hypothetical protein
MFRLRATPFFSQDGENQTSANPATASAGTANTGCADNPSGALVRVCGWVWTGIVDVFLFLLFLDIPQMHLLTFADEWYALHTNNRTIWLHAMVPVVALGAAGTGYTCRFGWDLL